MKTVIRVLLTTILCSLAWSTQAQYVIKFSHVVSPQTPKGKAADLFAERDQECTSPTDATGEGALPPIPMLGARGTLGLVALLGAVGVLALRRRRVRA